MSAEPTLMIESLDDFVRVLSQWHASQVALLKHLQDIPDGSEVSVDDGAPVTLEGDMKRGFIIGLKTALDHLGTLPFEVEFEQSAAPAETPAAQTQLDLEDPEVH